MPKRTIYLDYSATAPLRPQVRDAVRPYLADRYGNPSSIHSLGRDARVAVEDARARIHAALEAPRGRVAFSGSGSEADNLAVLGFARRHPGGCVVRSSIEHKAVVQATAALRRGGYDVRVAPVDPRGVVDLEALRERLPTDGRPTLVSVMWANNETGVIQPIERVGEICREQGALLHCDAVQAFGKLPIQLNAVPVDMLAISAHKLGGPKGAGALFVREGIELEPIVYGGGQEGGLRSGTENVAGIVGLATAAEVALTELADESRRLAALRDRLEDELRQALPDLRINGAEAPERLPNVLNLSIPGVDIEGVLTALDLEGICVSSGSACTTGSIEPSHVMTAMGREGDDATNTIRLSLGWGTREPEIEYVLETFPRVIERVRQLVDQL